MHSKMHTKIYYKTSLSEDTRKNLKYILQILDPTHCTLVGTSSNYFDLAIKEIFGEEYSGDIDISVTKEYVKKRNLEDKLYSEGFVKGAVTEETDEKKKRVLPDSYVLMKFNKMSKKEIDILLGFHISSPYFYKPLENKRDIKKISERRNFDNFTVNVLNFEHQIAEKLILPEEKRTKSFHKLFQVALILEYKPRDLAEEISEIIKEYSRNRKSIRKWWKQLNNFNYIFGEPKIKREKQRFFKYLEQKLNL